MSIRIKLIGAKRYAYGPKGEIFEKGFEYDLDDEKARTMLKCATDDGVPYFARVEAPAPETVETEVEEVTSPEVGGVRIKRGRGRPKRNPKVKAAGDTSELKDNVAPPPADEDEDEDEGVEV